MTRAKLGTVICGAIITLTGACKFQEPTVEDYATGLTNPRGLSFGSGGRG